MTTMRSVLDPAAGRLPPLIGTSPAIQLARDRVGRFARSLIPVLLVGPTGTGKELLAQHLHRLSGRIGELIDVNCGALPRDMIESLMFGHRKGAFTGAMESTMGFVLRAHRGTLFLDELASLPPEGQAKLLRVLETGEVLPLGAAHKQPSDFRLVAAVQEDIGARVQSGLFRRDLFHRVAGLRIELPALVNRREDIPLLATHFAQARGCALTPGAMALLRGWTWPGNVRELRALIDRAAILAPDSVLDAAVIAEGLSQCAEIPESDARIRLVQFCQTHEGRAREIAAALGVSRATLFRRLRACGISLYSLRVAHGLKTR